MSRSPTPEKVIFVKGLALLLGDLLSQLPPAQLILLTSLLREDSSLSFSQRTLCTALSSTISSLHLAHHLETGNAP